MKYRTLTREDVWHYMDDIYSCYKTNHLVFDNQCPFDFMYPRDSAEFIQDYVEARDSCVVGIFDNNENFLLGLIILDNIRMANRSIAQLHIVNDKSIFGKKARDIYKQFLDNNVIDTFYAEIPTIAVHAIGICKRLGFKKTGYIPDALPYTNNKGEERMYDLQIWTYRKGEPEICQDLKEEK